MINIALTQPYPKLDETLQQDTVFQQALCKLLQNSNSIVLRGKALLTFLLLFKMNPKWFVIAIEMEFYKNVDKLLRDNFKYVQCCLLCLIEQVATITPTLTQKALAAFQNPPKSFEKESVGVMAVLQGSKREYSQLKGDMILILALQELVATSSFK